jgi:hypothetical protein
MEREVVKEIGDLLNGRVVGSGGTHRTFGSGLRRLFRLRGFGYFSRWACLGPTLSLGVDFVALPFFPVVSRSLRVGLVATSREWV